MNQMKQILILTSLLLISSSLFSQEIIENPGFSATTANYVKITKIELHDTITKIDFKVNYFPKWWIQVLSDKTFIQNSDGGEKYYVKRAEGIELNEKHWTPESGVNNYTLYFSAIGPGIEKIDFIEEQWKLFDIDLTGTVATSFIPEEIQGNWLKTDGSNEWVYCIYDDKVIFQGTLWNNVLLKSRGKNYELTLKDGSEQKNIYIKLKKENLLIGNSPKNLQIYSKAKTYNPNYIIERDEEYSLPVFNIDTSIYKGFIEGYHPKMGSTGMAYVNDIVSQEQYSHLITIEQDGSFYCKIPMIYPKQIFIRMLSINESIYLEPGKTTFHYLDLSEFTSAYKNYKQRKERERRSLYMGDVARVNSDLLAMDTIYYFDYDETQKAILDMNGSDFKTYCLNVMEKEQEALSRFIQKNQVSKKALLIKEMQIPYSAYSNILSYRFTKSSAYRKKHKIPREQREIPLEDEIFEPEYYDFINAADLNNPISLVTGSAYNTLINRLRFSESIRPKANYVYIALKDSMKVNGVSLTEREEKILNNLIECGNNINCIKEIINSDTLAWSLFMKNHAELISSIHRDARLQRQSINMKEYFGLDKGLATEIMFAQSKCGIVKGMQKPFSEDDKNEIEKNITNDFIANYLIQYSDNKEREIEEKLQANKFKTGYVVNETPKTEGDQLFDAIMQKYKGKVVFVDFWATWCGPCRSGMEKMKPLKEELQDEDIEFVYITNPTSPVDTWNMMIPDIKGEHYRVEQDEWNHFASKFNISGIPHYLLLDKNGIVVNDRIFFASSNEQLKAMFNEYLNQ
jgi:thiol-disulfide isomerase/thioredoxin